MRPRPKATNSFEKWVRGEIGRLDTAGGSGGVSSSVGGGSTTLGIGSVTGMTQGSIPFGNASGSLSQDNANLFWDNANNRLGIGTSTPSTTLHVVVPGAHAAREDQVLIEGAGSFTPDVALVTINQTTSIGNSTIFEVTREGGSKFKVDNEGDATFQGALKFASGTADITAGVPTQYVGYNNGGYNEGHRFYSTNADPGRGAATFGAGAHSQKSLNLDYDWHDVIIRRDVDGASSYSEAGALLRLERDITNVTAENGNYIEVDSVLILDNAGLLGLNETSPGAQLQVNTSGTTVVGQIIKATAAQSANLTEWQDSSANVLASVDEEGNIMGGGTATFVAPYSAFLSQNNKWLQIYDGTAVSASTNFASLLLTTNQSGTAHNVGIVSFVNAAIGGADNRVAQMFGRTDGAIDSGAYIFSTANAGTMAEKMRINKTGNVLIGHTSSTVGLVSIKQQVDNDEGGLAVWNSGGGLRTVRLWCDASNNAYLGSGNGGAGPLIINEGAGLVGFGTLTPGAKVGITSHLPLTIGAIIKGAAAQSANLTEWQDSSGTVLASIDSNGVLDLDRAIELPTETITASSDTLDGTNYTVLCDCTSNAITINLPAASGVTGRVYHIKKIDSTGNAVTIDGSGSETIDGSTTVSINTQYTSLCLHCDGTEWHII